MDDPHTPCLVHPLAQGGNLEGAAAWTLTSPRPRLPLSLEPEAALTSLCNAYQYTAVPGPGHVRVEPQEFPQHLSGRRRSMGAGASTVGAGASSLPEQLDKEAARAFVGDKFDEAANAAFERAANHGFVSRAAFLGAMRD